MSELATRDAQAQFSDATSAIQETGKREPFVTAKDVVASGLFPELSEEKLRHYVRQGYVRAYGPGKFKTYLVSEVYEDWKNIGRRTNGAVAIQKRPGTLDGRLPKAWRKV